MSRTRSDWRPTRPGVAQLSVVLETFNVDSLDHHKFLMALRRDGAALLRLPAADNLAANVLQTYSSCARFFASPFSEKADHGAADGVGQQHGYMSYLDDDDGSECFEAKLHHDPRFHWPHGLRRAVHGTFALLLRTGHLALTALVDALRLDPAYVSSLLDLSKPEAAEAAAASGAVDLSTASHTAMRIWQYTKSRASGWHCDNTLLTLAPAGTRIGLECRSPVSNRVYRPEDFMFPDDILVFAGDALSYLAGGAVPALMHRVAPPPQRASAKARGPSSEPRLSAPCFLRARRAAMLVAPPIAQLPPLRVAELEHNAGNLRGQWHWKKDVAYYEGQTWHSTLS